MKRKITFLIAAAIMLLSLIVQPVSAIGQTRTAGDVLAQLANTAGSGYATRQTKTDNYSVGWVLSGSSSGTWGSNNSQKANVKPTAADLPVVKGVTSSATTETQWHYFYYTTTAVSNVGSIEFSFANTYDTGTSCNVYIVMGSAVSADGGDAYTQVELSNTSTTSQGASISAAGTYTFTFAETQTSARFYGLVIKVANNGYKRFASASLTLKEGSTGPATFSVTYNAGAGTGSPVVDNNGGSGYTSGTSYTVKGNAGDGNPNFLKTGYSFYAWYDNVGLTGTAYGPGHTTSYSITGNTTLYAKWNINQYNVAVSEVAGVTLTATYGGSSTIAETENANLDYGTTVTLNAAGLGVGQTFVWRITKTTGGDDVTASVLDGTTLTVPDYDITIGGTITTTYSVTYDCNGGTSGCPENVSGIVPSTSITLAAAPTKTGNVFMGWKVGSTTYQAGASYQVNGNVTFTAQWRAGATCKVNFGSSSGYFNLSSASSFNDALGNTWTATPSWASGASAAYNAQSNYVQVGTSSGYLNSITFSTTLPEDVIIIAFSAKIGGYSGTTGTIDLQVDGSSIGSASLNGTSDITATNSNTTVGKELTVSIGDEVQRIKCYYVEYTYVEIGSDPYINAAGTINISSTDTNNELAFEILNPDGESTLSASSTTDWISAVVVDSENGKVTFTTTVNESTTDSRSGSITLSYEGADDKTVTVNQGKADYASLPFSFDSGKSAIATTTGLSQSGLDNTDYASSPKLKFNSTGDYVVLKLIEAPVTISYDIKGNGFSGGTYKVQVSSDGINYDDLAIHTTELNDGNKKSFTHICNNNSVRYIRWIYTIQSSGNVGLGNINATNSASINNLTINSNETLTVGSNAILTLTGTVTNNGTLVIEDGGQLICSTSVSATVKKKITAPTPAAEKDGDVYGWYTISSPVHTGSYAYVTIGNETTVNLTADDYDMFAYDEATQKWINRKSGGNASGFNEMYKGQGYIYRNSGNELSFVGNTNVDAIDCPLTKASTGDLAGFNLIGNPYTHSITKGKGKAIDTDDASFTTGFFVLEDNAWATYKDGDEIKANQGVLVKVTDAAATFQIKDVNYVAPAKSNGDNIKFIVSNGQFKDVAYALFDKGIGLDKINHRSPDVPMLYINQDGQDYAIATMSDDTKTFNLNFKAGKMGKYTLSFNANDHFNYLHLIDLLTGEDVDMLLEKEYSFIATPNDNENRFIVRLGYMPNNNSTENETFAYQNGNDVIVSGDGELQVFDVTGRMVATQCVNGVETINMPSHGVYIFKLNEKVQKIVVR